MARAFQVVVVLAALWLGSVASWMAATAHFDPTPHTGGFSSPVLALELARTGRDVADILADPIGAENRAVMAGQIFEDWFFIPAYWAVFAGLAMLQDRSGRPLARWLGPAVLCAVTIAAAFDVQENRAILRVLGCPGIGLPDAAALAIRRPSLVKWGALFAACALVSPLFLGRTGDGRALRLLAPLTGLLLLLAGLLGAVGLARNPLIEIAMPALSLALSIALLLFVLLPRSFRSNL